MVCYLLRWIVFFETKKGEELRRGAGEALLPGKSAHLRWLGEGELPTPGEDEEVEDHLASAQVHQLVSATSISQDPLEIPVD